MDIKTVSIGVLLATTISLSVLAFKNPSVVSIPTDLKADVRVDMGNIGESIGANMKAPIVNVKPEITVQAPATESRSLGAVAGGDFYFPVKFLAGNIISSTFATSSTGTPTLSASSLEQTNTILHTNAGTTTLTLPASTTVGFLPKAGDTKRMLIVNQGTNTLTIAGGTGTLLYTASSTKAVNANGVAILDFIRKTNTDIAVFMSTAI